ncbi:C-GCAxxG-C-C family (seleno)protein [Desulfotomaculum sp. 1211_IL3151]|uniref:C-GCAxxG-C-C family (seleno)protein n=1 Tax=Desulfotomaculum sp. 1211_IL3151 TaxID=3084055 RepID=UPI002FDB266D
MSQELITEARNKAGGNFKEGYNCAEAIFLAFREYLAPEISPETVKLITGFGGGLGHAGCMCGALTGSIFALNTVKGRTSKEESRNPAYETAREFHDRFLQQFGSTCCRVLNEHPFDSKEHLKNCLKLTGNTGKLLMEFLLEKGYYKAGE